MHIVRCRTMGVYDVCVCILQRCVVVCDSWSFVDDDSLRNVLVEVSENLILDSMQNDAMLSW